ncbi:MAG: hypothetical protein IMZ53_12525 [Thermoplasmata archaeon]|nr:hypothetical protein [Thermoplasmata archaeon]MBE3141391.1 hypothetical protein [Thermoplasmata archaeon]
MKTMELDDYKKARIIVPKPNESKMKPPSEDLLERYKYEEIERRIDNTIEEEAKMNYNKIIELGKKLQESEIKEMSTPELYRVLEKATHTLGRSALRRYAEILKHEGFIRFTSRCVWEIVPEDEKNQQK